MPTKMKLQEPPKGSGPGKGLVLLKLRMVALERRLGVGFCFLRHADYKSALPGQGENPASWLFLCLVRACIYLFWGRLEWNSVKIARGPLAFWGLRHYSWSFRGEIKVAVVQAGRKFRP